jgi:hypothetical protein
MRRTFQIIWLISIIVLPYHITAQLISVKTVPLATGEQFHVFPSQNFGMANVSIAVDDPLLDPFVNPAKGGIHTGSHIVFAPLSYKISGNESSSKTLPLTIILNKNRWFFTSSLSIQELNLGRAESRNTTLGNKKLKNSYFYGSYGRRLGDGQTFLAGGLYWADLRGIDGVEHLYSDFRDISQSGKILDFRLGFLTQIKKDYSVEALLIHNHFYMEHEFTITNRFIWWQRPTTTQDTEYDHTNTWGLHLGYVQPFVLNPPWKVGFNFTVNYKSHPKIPNYDLMKIPRDPGNTWAYNLGIGLAQNTGKFVFGFDIIYEPIWSHTWADAENIRETTSGKKISKGDKTIENFFTFSNSTIRVGLTQEQTIWGFQLGLQLHTISYDLKQNNFVEEFQRKLDESWLEWTMSWGLFFKFSDFRLSYMGRVINGTGRPGVLESIQVRGDGIKFSEMSNFIIAPSGSLTLDEAQMILHQIILSVPI